LNVIKRIAVKKQEKKPKTKSKRGAPKKEKSKEILKKKLPISPDLVLGDIFYKEVQRELFKRNYYEFFKWAFKVLHPDDTFSDAPHIKYLCDTIQVEIERISKRIRKKKDIIINVPPRTSKSLIFSVCLLPWAWLKLPSLKMISVSYDEQLVINNSRMCKDLITSSQYRDLFGELFSLRSDSNSVTFFQNDKGGSRMSKTTGSSIVGFGANLIVVDDPQSPDTSRSETKRVQIQNYYDQNLYNRLTPIQLGVRVVVQQRLHEKDLTGHLLEMAHDKYLHINLPAKVSEKSYKYVKPESLLKIYTKEGLLDPVRLDDSTLDDLKTAVGTFGFNSQYLQDPQNEEGGILKKMWFTIKNPNEVIRDRSTEPIHFFLDTAYTEKTSNDPSAIMAAWRSGNEIYILKSESKRLTFPDLCKYVKEFTAAYGYDHNSIIHVEPKASGISLVQQLKAQTMLNIVESEAPKDDKISRVNSISPIVESRRVNLIQGGWNEPFLDQVCAISETKLPEHDDEADILCMAVRKLLIKANFDFMFI
jgi:predicted phage terminase large subunit-like protein